MTDERLDRLIHAWGYELNRQTLLDFTMRGFIEQTIKYLKELQEIKETKEIKP